MPTLWSDISLPNSKITGPVDKLKRSVSGMSSVQQKVKHYTCEQKGSLKQTPEMAERVWAMWLRVCGRENKDPHDEEAFSEYVIVTSSGAHARARVCAHTQLRTLSPFRSLTHTPLWYVRCTTYVGGK